MSAPVSRAFWCWSGPGATRHALLTTTSATRDNGRSICGALTEGQFYASDSGWILSGAICVICDAEVKKRTDLDIDNFRPSQISQAISDAITPLQKSPKAKAFWSSTPGQAIMTKLLDVERALFKIETALETPIIYTEPSAPLSTQWCPKIFPLANQPLWEDLPLLSDFDLGGAGEDAIAIGIHKKLRDMSGHIRHAYGVSFDDEVKPKAEISCPQCKRPNAIHVKNFTMRCWWCDNIFEEQR